MLKVKDGTIEAEGYRFQLLSDLSVILMAFVEKHIATKEELHDMVDIFAKTEKQFIRQRLIDHIDEMDNIGDAFNLLMQVLSDGRLDD